MSPPSRTVMHAAPADPEKIERIEQAKRDKPPALQTPSKRGGEPASAPLTDAEIGPKTLCDTLIEEVDIMEKIVGLLASLAPYQRQRALAYLLEILR